ncbi:hypothetical protein VaNZ11_016745, partial [Volvox africanus]
SVLARWRRAVETRRLWRASLESIRVAHRRQLSTGVLGAWLQAVASAKAVAGAAAALAAQAKSRVSRQIQREALTFWRVAAHRRVTLRALLARHLMRTGVATARRVLAAWHVLAASLAAAKRRVQRIISRRESALLISVLRDWRGEVFAGSARRSAAHQLATTQARGVLASALMGWSGAAAVRRERAARQAHAVRVTSRRRLVGAFRVWRWAAEAASEREVVAVRASRTAALRTAFSGWLHIAEERNHLSTADLASSLRRATTWRDRRVIRSCLGALADHREHHLDLHQRAVTFWRRSTLAAVLMCWRVEVAWARWGTQEVAKIRTRGTQRLQYRCLSLWRSFVRATAAARVAADSLRIHRQRNWLAEVLGDWQLAAAESVAERARVATCSRRINRGCVKRAISAWGEAAAQRRATRRWHLALCRRLTGQRLRRILTEWKEIAAELRSLRVEADLRFGARQSALIATCFAGWSDMVRLLKAARAAAMTRGSIADHALLLHAMDSWHTAVAHARRAAAQAEAMAARRAAAVLPATLRAWAAVACEDETRRLQLAALRNLVHRRRLAFTKRTFEAWRDVVLDRQARDDELRRCIKRKKLAFGLFKQWYWEAFDSDVQATIWRMFHTTDPAAHSPEPSSRVPPSLRQPPQPPQSPLQPLPSYLLQHQQWVSRRTGTSYGPAGSARAMDLPALEPGLQDTAGLEAGSSGEITLAAAASSRPRALPAPSGRPASPQHDQQQRQQHYQQQRQEHSQQQQRQEQQQQPVRSTRGGAGGTLPPSGGNGGVAPHIQSRALGVPQSLPSPTMLPEAVRTLASTFDAVAAAQRARARGQVAATPVATAAGAAASTSSTAAAANSGSRTSAGPRSAAYPVLRPTDSSGSDPDDLRNVAAGAKIIVSAPPRRRALSSATPAAGRSTRSYGHNGTGNPVRKSSLGTMTVSSTARTPGVGRTSSSAGAANASAITTRRAGASMDVRRPVTGRSPARAPVLSSSSKGRERLPASGVDATAAVTAAVTAAAAAITPPSLEAMSAALNVMIRSLDLAAGAVHSSAGVATPTASTGTASVHGGTNSTTGIGLSARPSRITISSVGSAVGPSYVVSRGSADGSTSMAPSAGGVLPISPLSPLPHAQGNIAAGGTPVSSGGVSGGRKPSGLGGLPGVVPSWRQIAINQLYSCEEEWYGDMYGGDLDLVDSIYVGVPGAASGLVTQGLAASGPTSRKRRSVESRDLDGGLGGDMASHFPVTLTLCTPLGSAADGLSASSGSPRGAPGTLCSRRVSSDADSAVGVFPRHSIFQNAVFQPREEERCEDDEEGQEYGAALEDVAERSMEDEDEDAAAA